MNWITDHGLSLLDWPPQSPDINIIEHVWFYIKQLAKCSDASKSVHELWQRVERVWSEIPEQFLNNWLTVYPND